MDTSIFAHSANKAGVWHPLREHLESVSSLVEEFTADFPWQKEAILAALLHDQGKAGRRFADRLKGKEKGLDHWSAGAWAALTVWRSVAAALAIQGHHIGLQSADRSYLRAIDPDKLLKQHPLKLRLTDDPSVTQDRFSQIISSIPKVETVIPQLGFGAMFDTRVLFSALVDADFLDTEAHFQGDESGKCYRARGSELNPEIALEHLQDHIDRLTRERAATSDQVVLQARSILWTEMKRSASFPVGIHTLTAPTGSGKTLAMLGFALKHAVEHNLKRIVMVIPYLNILDQTAKTYRDIFEPLFGEGYVLEHHSLAGSGSDTEAEDSENDRERARRLLSENWDAPIVLTTNVQILESLFANRPSRCRKLHRLAKSVILFDEAQTLPPALAVSTLAALAKLSNSYQSSVVFSTATQPAFEHLHGAVTNIYEAGWKPVELVSKHTELFSMLKRVDIEWRREPTAWNTLYCELSEHQQVLCIVNLKKHAILLTELFKDSGREVFQLSTSMCSLHRQAVLKTVRERLDRKEPCLLITTQCIEAGVDVDFPAVYRAFGPLDAIAQAAGRCNREGRLTVGQMVVFTPISETGCAERYLYPTHEYYQAASMTSLLLNESTTDNLDIYDPELFRAYYRRLFDLSRPESGKKAQVIKECIDAGNYAGLADAYRLIDQDTISILVPYNQSDFNVLVKEADEKGINSAWQKRAQVTSVSVFRPKREHSVWGVIYAAKTVYGGESEEWHILQKPEFYDPVFGFRPPDAPQILIG
ncbi:CRISPR-associated helicase Cas3' [Desulfurispirillum indicum]|uniref:CRISPR-associated helicase Cas3' n=1 Tax=Desulfurispirillum indicum TaxID=936456 RepID=UPI001CFAA5C3|nr:CRISPR-associated helicase Cas3' [Desulfurispirillum indicum]UCZ57490.1 CRISPR-associated helicase Cas3' [Desulfurispirillum indicum]